MNKFWQHHIKIYLKLVIIIFCLCSRHPGHSDEEPTDPYDASCVIAKITHQFSGLPRVLETLPFYPACCLYFVGTFHHAELNSVRNLKQ